MTTGPSKKGVRLSRASGRATLAEILMTLMDHNYVIQCDLENPLVLELVAAGGMRSGRHLVDGSPSGSYLIILDALAGVSMDRIEQETCQLRVCESICYLDYVDFLWTGDGSLYRGERFSDECWAGEVTASLQFAKEEFEASHILRRARRTHRLLIDKVQSSAAM